MTLPQLNILNIGLMLAASAGAFFFPFELFLFSYAVLGPLHYLTQISWLHSRGYFASGRRDAIALAAGAVALLLLRFVLSIDNADDWATAVVLVVFTAALAFVLPTTPLLKTVLIGERE
jgi:hypothetical protein